MNKNQIPARSVLIDPLAEAVVVNSSERGLPVRINLNKMFGSNGLTFIVAAEDCDIIEPVVLQNRGQLYIYPGELVGMKKKTRLAIRATDQEGEAVATTISVAVEDLGDVKASIAA